jgi:hypothetical protein
VHRRVQLLKDWTPTVKPTNIYAVIDMQRSTHTLFLNRKKKNKNNTVNIKIAKKVGA